MSAPVSTASLPLIEGLSRRRRIGILLICSMSLLIVGLDVTIVNVALPSIGRDFDAPLSGLQWTVDAYTLVLASLLMLSGSTADRLGRRRTFVIGLLTFALGSLLCSLAPDLSLLIVFRMLQAVGGSMLNPVAMSIITNTFTIPRERAQAIGVWGAVVGISMALGPVVGGVLVTSVGWQSIFWINIPVALVAVVLARRYIPESKASVARKVDVPGQVFVITLLASLTYGIIEAPNRGWSSPLIIGSFATAAVSLLALLVWERRTSEPLIDLRFFRSVPFSAAALVAVAAFATLGGFLFLNTLYLQDVRGLSALGAGLDTLPMAVMTMVFSPLSGRIVGRRGGRVPLVVAGIALHRVLPDARRARCDHAVHVALHRLRDLRRRFRVRQRADHEHRCLRDAAGPGRRGVGHRLDLASDRSDPGCGRGRLPGVRLVAAVESSRFRPGQSRRVVGPRRVRGRRLGPWPRGDVGLGPAHGPADGRAAQPRVPRREPRMTKPGVRHDRSARAAWQAMGDLVLDNQRRREVTEQTGVSFGRMKALRRIAVRPMPMRELAGLLGMDPPNLTAVIDDLERSGLVERQAHPTDRRVKLVVVTPQGAALAQRAEDILHRPPAGLSDLPAEDLEALTRILARIRGEREPER